jgi:nicotinate-nucleotide adenylyltransferase
MKIAIYSGSFNPIHNGHIAVAEAALDEGFDEVWLVVTPQNPHKKEEGLWHFEDRLAMAELAIANHSGLKVSDCENKLPTPYYTINTLSFLQKTFPEHQFKLLIGGDNLLRFKDWKDHQQIIDSFGLVVYPRPDFPFNPYSHHPNVDNIKAPLLDISSSEIRKRLERNEPINGLVSTEVENFIHKMIISDQSKSVF